MKDLTNALTSYSDAVNNLTADDMDSLGSRAVGTAVELFALRPGHPTMITLTAMEAEAAWQSLAMRFPRENCPVHGGRRGRAFRACTCCTTFILGLRTSATLAFAEIHAEEMDRAWVEFFDALRNCGEALAAYRADLGEAS